MGAAADDRIEVWPPLVAGVPDAPTARELTWRRSLVAGFVLLGLGYSVLMPAWEAPNEEDHYRLALHVARAGQIDPSNVQSRQPPLYYALASLPLRALDAVDPILVDFYRPERRDRREGPIYAWTRDSHRVVWGLLVLRWLDLGLGALTVLFVQRAARRFVRSVDVSLAATACAALTPQFLHISASVNNAALANLAGALLLWRLGVLYSEDLRGRDLVLTALAAIALPLLTKLTVLPMGAAVLFGVLRQVWHHPRLRSGRVMAFAAGAVGLGLAAGAALFPEDLWQSFVGRVVGTRPVGAGYLLLAADRLAWTYWGMVGYRQVGLPPGIVVGLAMLGGIGVLAGLRLLFADRSSIRYRDRPLVLIGIGLLLAAAAWSDSWLAIILGAIAATSLHLSFRREVPAELSNPAGWRMLFAAAALTFAATAKNAVASRFLPSGRYLFPSIGVFSLLFVGGWLQILPPRARRLLPALTVAVMLAANAILWVRIEAFYFQPFLD